MVQPIDGNLGNTAEVTYRGITRGNALKKSVKARGLIGGLLRSAHPLVPL